MGLLGTWGCRAGRHHAPWLPKCLSTGIFEAVSGCAVLGNSHVLVANAGLSGVTCSLPTRALTDAGPSCADT